MPHFLTQLGGFYYVNQSGFLQTEMLVFGDLINCYIFMISK